MSSTAPVTKKLTADHVAEYRAQGFVQVRDFLPASQHEAIDTALRAALPPWEAIRAEPPANRSRFQGFPYPDLNLNRFFVNPDLLWFARQALETEAIQYRAGFSIVRYPGELLGTRQGWHIDNGNNSLLPESEDPRYGQVVAWYWPEAVTVDHAPLRVIPKPFGNDTAHEIVLAVPANTLVLFHNYVWHSATDFAGADGQRYSHAGMYGRADFHWEGFQHYTSVGQNPTFKELISSLTPDERTVFRFPPPGHAYYTPTTLVRLEAQYPGFNASGAYG